MFKQPTERQENKNRKMKKQNRQKMKNKSADLRSNIPIITLNLNGLNIPNIRQIGKVD